MSLRTLLSCFRGVPESDNLVPALAPGGRNRTPTQTRGDLSDCERSLELKVPGDLQPLNDESPSACSPFDHSHLGGSCDGMLTSAPFRAVVCAGVTRPAFRRDNLICTVTPAAVTVFNEHGYVLHQNTASVCYLGDRMNNPSSNVDILAMIFQLEQEKLDRMLRDTDRDSGGVWRGIVRVPYSLATSGGELLDALPKLSSSPSHHARLDAASCTAPSVRGEMLVDSPRLAPYRSFGKARTAEAPVPARVAERCQPLSRDHAPAGLHSRPVSVTAAQVEGQRVGAGAAMPQSRTAEALEAPGSVAQVQLSPSAAGAQGGATVATALSLSQAMSGHGRPSFPSASECCFSHGSSVQASGTATTMTLTTTTTTTALTRWLDQGRAKSAGQGDQLSHERTGLAATAPQCQAPVSFLRKAPTSSTAVAAPTTTTACGGSDGLPTDPHPSCGPYSSAQQPRQTPRRQLLQMDDYATCPVGLTLGEISEASDAAVDAVGMSGCDVPICGTQSLVWEARADPLATSTFGLALGRPAVDSTPVDALATDRGTSLGDGTPTALGAGGSMRVLDMMAGSLHRAALAQRTLSLGRASLTCAASCTLPRQHCIYTSPPSNRRPATAADETGFLMQSQPTATLVRSPAQSALDLVAPASPASRAVAFASSLRNAPTMAQLLADGSRRRGMHHHYIQPLAIPRANSRGSLVSLAVGSPPPPSPSSSAVLSSPFAEAAADCRRHGGFGALPIAKAFLRSRRSVDVPQRTRLARRCSTIASGQNAADGGVLSQPQIAVPSTTSGVCSPVTPGRAGDGGRSGGGGAAAVDDAATAADEAAAAAANAADTNTVDAAANAVGPVSLLGGLPACLLQPTAQLPPSHWSVGPGNVGLSGPVISRKSSLSKSFRRASSGRGPCTQAAAAAAAASLRPAGEQPADGGAGGWDRSSVRGHSRSQRIDSSAAAVRVNTNTPAAAVQMGVEVEPATAMQGQALRNAVVQLDGAAAPQLVSRGCNGGGQPAAPVMGMVELRPPPPPLQPTEGATAPLVSAAMTCAGEDCWHEVWASRAVDPVTGQGVIIVSQHDVTAKVVAERHLALVMEAEHRLLEQLFPKHILTHVTEEWIAEADRATAAAVAAAAVPAGAGGGRVKNKESAAVVTLAARRNSGMARANAVAKAASGTVGHSSKVEWRPVVRDCDALATWHPEVTLLFADIKGFTPMCEQVTPRAVMTMLNDLFSRFDGMLDKFGVFKVETIGDCYFVAGGLIREDEDGMAAVRDNRCDPLHAHKVFMFAKAMLSAARSVRMPTTDEPVQIRIGICSGPVVSGVVGTRMPRFCLFGDTVNTTSRMESTGQPGAIHASQSAYELLRAEAWEPTGGIEVKGKGRMQTYLWRPPVEDGEPSVRHWPDSSASAAAAAAAALKLRLGGSSMVPYPGSHSTGRETHDTADGGALAAKGTGAFIGGLASTSGTVARAWEDGDIEESNSDPLVSMLLDHAD